MAITQKLREIGGIINATDLNYNFNRMQEDLTLALEGLRFDDKYGNVDTIVERNAIPTDSLKEGLWTTVVENGMVYRYTNAYNRGVASANRVFGLTDGDLPTIPYEIEGDSDSPKIYNVAYQCNVDSEDENWQYFSNTTGVTYNDGDWAIFVSIDGTTEGTWKYAPKWVGILDVTGILENGLVGKLDDLETDNKDNIVGAMNEILSELGDVDSLDTENKTSAVDAINELNKNIGALENLDTETKESLVEAINELIAKRGDLADLTTSEKGTVVGAINEVDKDVGDVTQLTTNDTSDVVSAINEIKSITDGLRGSTIVIGKISLDTSAVTDALLTARALEIMSATEVQTGWTLVDNEQNEWHWNGSNWQNLEQPNLYAATNDSLGTIQGNSNGDVTFNTAGIPTVLHAANATKLGDEPASYYASVEEMNKKADKTNVIEKDSTEDYTPTEETHPTNKKYVDDLMVESVVWGGITGTLSDQEDLQEELDNKQDLATAWNKDNLIASNTLPTAPESGYILWIDLSE